MPLCEVDVLLGSGVHRGPETRRLNVRRHRRIRLAGARLLKVSEIPAVATSAAAI